jgi:hypothetical protein
MVSRFQITQGSYMFKFPRNPLVKPKIPQIESKLGILSHIFLYVFSHQNITAKLCAKTHSQI